LRYWVDWVPVGLSKGDRQIALAGAPEVRAHVGPLTVLLGLVVPIVGPQTSPRIVSGELALVLDL
jgi:hypothetical protein